MTTAGWTLLIGWVGLVLTASPVVASAGLPAWTQGVLLLGGLVGAVAIARGHRRPPPSPPIDYTRA